MVVDIVVVGVVKMRNGVVVVGGSLVEVVVGLVLIILKSVVATVDGVVKIP